MSNAGVQTTYDIIKAHGREIKPNTEKRKKAELIIGLP